MGNCHNRAAFRGRSADETADPLAGVADVHLGGEEAVELADALAAIGERSPDARAALELHWLDGETWAAIGVTRGVTGNAVPE